FVNAGGTIFTQADNANDRFSTFVESKLALALVPDVTMREIDKTDALFSCQYKIKSSPKLRGLWNGSRWVLIHSPGDIAGTWLAKNQKSLRVNFELPINLFVYAGGSPDLNKRGK